MKLVGTYHTPFSLQIINKKLYSHILLPQARQSSVFTMFEAASNMNEDDAKAPSQESAKTSTEDNAKDNKDSVATEDNDTKDNNEPTEAETLLVKLEFKLVDWSFMKFQLIPLSNL